MLRYKSQPESLRLYFRLLDTQSKGYITSSEVLLFVRDMLVKLVEIGITLEYRAEDVRDEVFDLARPTDRNKITLQDLSRCRSGDTIVGMITDAQRFYNYDQREFNPALAKESVEQIIPPPQEYDQQQMQQQQQQQMQQQYRENDDLDMYDTSPNSNSVSNQSKKRGQTGQNQITNDENDYSGNFYYGNEGQDEDEGNMNMSGSGGTIPSDANSDGSSAQGGVNADSNKKSGDSQSNTNTNTGHDALLADTLFPGTEKKAAEEEDDDFY
ncbi:MAG: hypothetical protein EZS28_024448 [Streblomastix strix]|uniref:EF-hand domain-containing protein n=1 Tax=Streblomastix strix TaxID=222440 RepID=A0A5J4VBU4_9EUKA|nr:MAG: hypothetical protein EZS28_024448 [Streblomastix strix]